MPRPKNIVITLSGLAGSGKSSAARELAKRFKLRHVSAGDIFRAVAKERGLDPIELGRYADKHPEFDKALDARMLREVRKGRVIADGRTMGYLTRKRGIKALRVFLTVDPLLAARRVSKRDGTSVAETLKKSRIRERENARRLKRLYGLDISDPSYYDVVIRTDGYTNQEVVELISALLQYGT